MKCLLLGAGYATRLYPLTQECPKPLLPVGGIPILERILEKVAAAKAVDRAYVVTNHRFSAQYDHWLQGFRKPAFQVEIIDDQTTSNADRLGAIGDIDFVMRSAGIEDDLLVIAGDNLFDFPLEDFLAFALQKRAAIALYDVKDLRLASLYGIVTTAEDGRVTGFEEKPPAPKATLACLAVYFFGREYLPRIRQYLEAGGKKDALGHYIEWFHQQVPLFGWLIPGSWYDIGDLDSYQKANERYTGKENSSERQRRAL